MSISNAALIGLGIIAIVFLLGKFGRGGIVLIILAVPVIGLYLLVHSFQAFTSTTLVATVQASPVVNAPHTIAIAMTTYDPSGNPTHAEYELDGDRWELNADVVAFPDWMNFLGISNGFQLSRLTSQYEDTNAHTITPIGLGGGNSTVTLPFIEKSHYRNGVIEPDDGVTYNVYCTLQGDVYAQRA
jgi:hypothetical protein